MSIITRKDIRLPLHILHPMPSVPGRFAAATGYAGETRRIQSGDLVWDTDTRRLSFTDSETGALIVQLSDDNCTLTGNMLRIHQGALDVRVDPVMLDTDSWWDGLLTQGIITRKPHSLRKNGTSCVVELSPDLGTAAQEAFAETVGVSVSDDNGNTEEVWSIPVNATRPCDLLLSPDCQLTGKYCLSVDEHPSWDENRVKAPRLIFFCDRFPA